MSTQHGSVDDVDRWLKAADPASHLTPLLPWQLHHLKEIAMTSPTTTTTQRRRRVLGLATSGAVAAAIVGGIVITSTAGGGSVTALTAPPAGGPAAMCAEVTPEGLASSTLAFRGTVTGISDGIVALTVNDTFTGDVEDSVTLPQGDVNSQLDGAAPVFEDGQTYLVAAADDIVRSCGLTGTDSPALTAVYDQAFPR